MAHLTGKSLLLLLTLIFVSAGCSKILAYPEVHAPEDGDADTDDGFDAADTEMDRDALDDNGEDLDEIHDEMQDTEDAEDADEIEGCEPGSTWILSFDTDLPDSAGAALVKTPEGHLVLAATTMNGGIGGSDILLAKLDGCGTVLGAMAVGLMGDDAANDIVRTPDGSFVVAGMTHYFFDSQQDTWILKLDADLTDVRWQRSLATEEGVTITAMTATAENRFAVVGTTDSDPRGTYVAMIASNGDPVWQEVFTANQPFPFDLFGSSVAELGDRILVTVRADPDEPSLAGWCDAWILCLEKSDGSVHWIKGLNVDDYVDGYEEFAADVLETPMGTILLTGYIQDTGWFSELSADGGTLLYCKQFYVEASQLRMLPLGVALIDSESSIAIAGTAVNDSEGLNQMYLATMTGVASPRDNWLAFFGRDLADRPGSNGFAEMDDGLVLAGWSEDSENLWQLVLIKMGDDGGIQDPCSMEGGLTDFTIWDEHGASFRNPVDVEFIMDPVEDPFETTYASTRDVTAVETTILCPAE